MNNGRGCNLRAFAVLTLKVNLPEGRRLTLPAMERIVARKAGNRCRGDHQPAAALRDLLEAVRVIASMRPGCAAYDSRPSIRSLSYLNGTSLAALGLGARR